MRLTVDEMNAVMCEVVLTKPPVPTDGEEERMLQALQARIRAEVCREHADIFDKAAQSIDAAGRVVLVDGVKRMLAEYAQAFRARAAQEGQEGA